MKVSSQPKPFKTVVYFSLLLLAGACEDGRSPIEPPKRLGKLIVLTRNAPTTYYQNRRGEPAGVEYELAERFADDLDVRVKFKFHESIKELMRALRNGEGHYIAGLTRTKSREDRFLWGPSYQKIQPQVVCRKGVNIQKVKGLKGKKLLVMKNSSYEERLTKLKEAKHEFLKWKSTAELSPEQILKKVWEGEVDCTVVDSHIVKIHRRYFPELDIALPLGEPQKIAWVLPKQAKALQGQMETWFEKIQDSGFLESVQEEYYDYTSDFDYYDTKVFLKRLKTRLPKYRSLFEKAAKKYEFDWKLLAAISYQESHWDPKAESPTGVRGLMMLTRRTAREVGVSNRLDPEQSVMGGAKYLKKITQRVPSYIPEPDRKWMGIAAYNVGYAHFRDARSLAVRLEKNSRRWPALKETLPLLSQPKYYRSLPYGYARGVEPVVYVERIRNYYDLIENEWKKAKKAQEKAE